jgi:Na+/H+-dicarboxylate symporter
MASLGLITGVLGFDQSGVALILSIFALQDSFGTACNVTGDGAIALMVTGIAKRYMKGDESAVQG